MEDALHVGVICKMNDLDKHGVKEAERISSKAEINCLKFEIFYKVSIVKYFIQ